MAVVTVSEFSEMMTDKNGRVLPIPKGAPLAVQSISLSGTSAAISNAFDGRTKYVRIACDGGCHIAFADSPTATTSNELWPSGLVEFRSVDETDGNKVAAIQAS